MKVLRLALVAALFVGASVVPAGAQDQEADMSPNVKPLQHFEYDGGSHIAFGNGFAYAGEVDGVTNRDQNNEGGVHIYDVRGKKVKEAGFFECEGSDHDIAYVKPGLIAVGYGSSVCGADPVTYGPGGTSSNQAGLYMLDVSDPAKPKRLGAIAVSGHPDNQTWGGYSHTLAAYPGTDYVYVGGGGLGRQQAATSIVDVSNPAKPEVAAVYRPNQTGCHDLSIFIKKDKKLGFCAGGGEVQIWDVSDPIAPVTIATINNPLIQIPHYGLASPDGDLLVIDDEAVVWHECTDQVNAPAGAIWMYDISDPTSPEMISWFSPRRGNPVLAGQVPMPVPLGTLGDNTTTALCTSHEYNFVGKTRFLSVSWYTGGSSIVDLSDPANPTEVAYYQHPEGNTWTAYWHGNRWYHNDLYRGFEVLKVKLPKPAA